MLGREAVICAIVSLIIVVSMVVLGVDMAFASLIFIIYYGLMLSVKTEEILFKLKEKEKD